MRKLHLWAPMIFDGDGEPFWDNPDALDRRAVWFYRYANSIVKPGIDHLA